VRVETLSATVERQIWSRFRAPSYWVGAVLPVALIGALLYQTGKATGNPAMTMFLAILSALWIGGSACVREVVDERKLVQREPHLSLLAYALAKMLHAALLAAGQSLILTLAVLFSGVVRLPLFSLWLILFLTTLSGSFMALILSALCDEAATALAWFPLVLVPQVVFGGFLFPYAETRPFAIEAATGQVIEMPPRLVRTPVTQGALRTAGALSVSRWALEGYASRVLEQDLSDVDALNEAVRVTGLVPLTLGDVPVSERLIGYFAARSRGEPAEPPAFDAGSGRYLGLLALFAVVQAGLLVLILPVRDPRRA
jgi:hypothetical protein